MDYNIVLATSDIECAADYLDTSKGNINDILIEIITQARIQEITRKNSRINKCSKSIIRKKAK